MASELKLHLADEAATVSGGSSLGQACLAAGLQQGLTLYLNGQLGAGKTTFCRGVLRAFGHEGAVKSPTYTLVEPYELEAHRVYHFDLYRLGDPEELEFMGVRDYFSAQSLSLVEWPERGEGILPAPDLEVELEVPESGRQLRLIAHSPQGERVIDLLQKLLRAS
ncbi:tRNA (adenosine(37)-N6)-threonylcarbamoyltransferase complex ATPase subunit type 1 TsaE [Microbulbifer sp. EKSA008]|uniref:tRNA (adenosine(37)-N6)-threonylcarbamoyltransferase complex ATPase subunit type 1 TsaE n=1 Tax=unclassified Microbulbifer TaxID=2619833 RepID=UPI000D52BA76|nr:MULTISPECIES: tRNA (adenosine(37)-N6)-threonylcarbamoyltransferase complex ATPase subunit type 1 TsaE [unclassified Microbulbifer]AWF79591.1 tRNA (adenosine(37)-N6)-threonylcarbamoyltransferase complex ATPase subunit type 1 TsaE [Microbulbifer sp. A4B17]WHI44553.1 tRNA (adenosine(37)-N6)-threonylcarbamoyltransferase complex ATPase subunit type 1 TsaE [Microbulbifer sp. VAAF005]WNZ56656.1 tRNA (adenosine(37)-N6)-threonylcarbamoyltransferase complex ATPase subunit type 1 TsaE [Microbulbifer sp.